MLSLNLTIHLGSQQNQHYNSNYQQSTGQGQGYQWGGHQSATNHTQQDNGGWGSQPAAGQNKGGENWN